MALCYFTILLCCLLVDGQRVAPGVPPQQYNVVSVLVCFRKVLIEFPFTGVILVYITVYMVTIKLIDSVIYFYSYYLPSYYIPFRREYQLLPLRK